MAMVTVEGVFLGANIVTRNFEGNTKTELVVDLYQPESNSRNKTVVLQSSDTSLFDRLVKSYAMGSILKAKVTLTAYQNNVYFKLVEIVDGK